jgi:diacylglycerol kinase (ATP)
MKVSAPKGARPVLIFINQKSGGKQGKALVDVFQKIVGERQVFDLSNGGPMPGLTQFKEVPNTNSTLGLSTDL